MNKKQYESRIQSLSKKGSSEAKDVTKVSEIGSIKVRRKTVKELIDDKEAMA